MMFSDDRELYDLCRRYNYYYKSYKEIEKLQDIYWSKYIVEAYEDVKNKLEKVENDILDLMLSRIIDRSALVMLDTDIDWDRYYQCKRKNSKVIIHDYKFMEIMKEFLQRKNEYRNVINQGTYEL